MSLENGVFLPGVVSTRFFSTHGFPGFGDSIPKRCKWVHCVDLGKSFPTHIYLQVLASIQPRTSPVKFTRSPWAQIPRELMKLPLAVQLQRRSRVLAKTCAPRWGSRRRSWGAGCVHQPVCGSFLQKLSLKFPYHIDLQKMKGTLLWPIFRKFSTNFSEISNFDKKNERGSVPRLAQSINSDKFSKNKAPAEIYLIIHLSFQIFLIFQNVCAFCMS